MEGAAGAGLSRRALLGVALVAAAPSVAQARRRSFWPGHARLAVSLTYDDGLNSQLQYAVPELDRRGYKATFFLTEENMAARLADWEVVAQHGHEIANHTVHHPCDLRKFDARSLERRELAPMERFIRQYFGPQPRTFAYPCGYIGLGSGDNRTRFARYERLLRRDFVAARTTVGPPNTIAAVRADPLRLSGFEPTYDADVVAPARRYLELAAREGAWAILVFHDVVPKWRGEGDASLKTHSAVLDLVEASGAWCAPMGAVMKRIRGRV
jgi:peptidoglycan/xylan/chitin deacetylase (PgdA/CDA1 family)